MKVCQNVEKIIHFIMRKRFFALWKDAYDTQEVYVYCKSNVLQIHIEGFDTCIVSLYRFNRVFNRFIFSINSETTASEYPE